MSSELVDFVRALYEDLTADREGWENPTLETSLTALASWLEDSDGYYVNHGRPVPAEPSWQTVAEMLIAARRYE